MHNFCISTETKIFKINNLLFNNDLSIRYIKDKLINIIYFVNEYL